jgi:hypothetical protein
MSTDELLDYVFDGQAHLLARPMASWLASSRRFTAFVTTFRDKIRKKLRATQDEEGLLDLRLELQSAYVLLQERSLSVVYEPRQSGQSGHVRGPDFAVSYTTSFTFMVEVTRLRSDGWNALIEPPEQSPIAAPPDSTSGLPRIAERLADTVCNKLGQLLPRHCHVLLAGVDSPQLTHNDLRAAMLRVQQRAERSEPEFLRRHGFRDRADFFRCYQRLSEILVPGQRVQADSPVIVWVNPRAKHPLPSKVRTALYRSHGR